MGIGLKPFWCYYGGKWRAAPHYPAPKHHFLVEPFAGAAGYSCRHYQKQVRLYDLDEKIVGLWQYLIGVKSSEVMSLPLEVRHVDDLRVCQEAKWLIGFWLNKASAQPHLQPSKWMRDGTRPNSHWGEVVRARLACQVDKIRHWKVWQCSYQNVPDFQGSWFIDPPYNDCWGALYRKKVTDYQALGEWCRERRRQVIVCERQGADWLPFQPFRIIKSTEGKNGKAKSPEALWYNES